MLCTLLNAKLISTFYKLNIHAGKNQCCMFVHNALHSISTDSKGN